MSTEDTRGNEPPKRFARQDDEPDDAAGHKADVSEDPDFSQNLGVDQPDGDDEGTAEKHNLRI
jgi:hypothetical protein